MNIHAKFTGEVESAIEEIVRRGRAASKTEAIRIAVLDYKDHHLGRSEEEDIRLLSSRANHDIWEDEQEDKVWVKYLKEGKK